MRSHGACAPEQRHRPQHEVADIFRAHGDAYRATHPLSAEQRKVMWCIEACRTAVLGGHLDMCADCGHEQPSYNSCRNRHCPKCQALDQARWIEQRRQRILPVSYFHVVFTLPGELRPLALRNRRLIFNLLFTTAAQTLLVLGRDPNRMQALLGITAVLHTWTRDLRWHPHLHCVVTGGGLALDGSRWVDSARNFLFPVKVIARLFRGKLVAGLQHLHQHGNLDLQADFDDLRVKLFAEPWVVYAKKPFAGPDQVFAYLGRYTHRIAISNHRLLSVTDDNVTIATRDGNTADMHPHQFIRRFLMHVLPDSFVKIRHYGLLASGNVNTKLERALELLEHCVQPREASAANDLPVDWKQQLELLTGIDLNVCPRCGSIRWRRVPIAPQKFTLPTRARAPPS